MTQLFFLGVYCLLLLNVSHLGGIFWNSFKTGVCLCDDDDDDTNTLVLKYMKLVGNADSCVILLELSWRG